MKCTECGKSLDQEYSFCPFCGAVIDKTQEEEAPIKEDRYDVVLTSLGKNPAEVIKPLASLFSCSVESVLEKTKHLPFVLAKDCDKEMAISVLIRWQRIGARVKMTETMSAKEHKKLTNLNKKGVLRIISSSLLILASFLMLVLPLFLYKYTTDDGVATQTYSLFSLAIDYSKALINKSITLSILNIGLITTVILCFDCVKNIYLSIKSLIIDIRNKNNPFLFRYTEIIASSIATDLGISALSIFWTSFTGLFLPIVIFIAIITLTAFILNKISYRFKTTG